VDAIQTDFSKAFDKVSHRLLFRKLDKLGFGGSFLAWIGSSLTGVQTLNRHKISKY
jgi:hypothetical protein